MEFALVLHEKSAADADGLIRNEAIDLIDMLSGKEFFPIEIEAKYHESTAMGFITRDFADKLNFDYEGSGLNAFIANILDDMNNEHDDCIYTFKDCHIWLTR